MARIRKRRGKDLNILWKVTISDGTLIQNVPLSNLKLEAYDERNNLYPITINSVDADGIHAKFPGEIQKNNGNYRLTLWINKFGDNTSVVDLQGAFELVPYSQMESSNNMLDAEGSLVITTMNIEYGLLRLSEFASAINELKDKSIVKMETTRDASEYAIAFVSEGGTEYVDYLKVVTAEKVGLMSPAMLKALTEDLPKGIKSLNVKYGDKGQVDIEYEKLNGNTGSINIPGASEVAAGVMTAQQVKELEGAKGQVAELSREVQGLELEINGVKDKKYEVEYRGWYIPTNGGGTRSGSGYIVSKPISLKSGNRIVVSSSAYGCCVIAKKTGENNYISLVNAQSSSGSDTQRTYSATEDTEVCICGVETDLQVQLAIEGSVRETIQKLDKNINDLSGELESTKTDFGNEIAKTGKQIQDLEKKHDSDVKAIEGANEITKESSDSNKYAFIYKKTYDAYNAPANNPVRVGLYFHVNTFAKKYSVLIENKIVPKGNGICIALYDTDNLTYFGSSAHIIRTITQYAQEDIKYDIELTEDEIERVVSIGVGLFKADSPSNPCSFDLSIFSEEEDSNSYRIRRDEKSIADIEETLTEEKEALEKLDSAIFKETKTQVSKGTINAYVDPTGKVVGYATYKTTQPFSVKKGDLVNVDVQASGVSVISTTNNNSIKSGDTVNAKVLSQGSATIVQEYKYVAEEDCNVVISYDAKHTPAIWVTHRGNLMEDNTEGISYLSKRANSANYSGNDSLWLRDKIENSWRYYIESNWDKKGGSGFVPPTSYNDGSYLDNKIRKIPSGKTFAFVTDTHIDKNSRKSTYLIDYVRKNAGFNKVIFGGDCVTAEETKYLAAQMLSKYADEFYSAFGKDGIWVQGNHDANSNVPGSTDVDRIDNIEIYNRTVKYIADKIVFDTDNIALLSQLGLSSKDLEDATYWMMMHYYYDDDTNKVRYIVLEMGDRSNGRGVLDLKNDWAASHIQLDFLAKSLLSVPEGYNVVVSGHQIGGEYGLNQGQREFVRMLSAYKSKSSYSLTKNSWYYGSVECTNAFALWQLQGGKIHTYNFSSVNVEGTPIVIGGHWHWDDAFICHSVDGVYKAEEYDAVTAKGNDAVLVIWTSCDMHPASPYEKTDEGHLEHVTTPSMTNGTITEHCFDVVTINGNKVYCTRFGAGNDREFVI